MIEDFGVADVARVNNPFTTLQCSKGFSAEQTMGIGNHAHIHAALQNRFKHRHLLLKATRGVTVALVSSREWKRR
ncbi:hypothetical protein D3C87_2043110 [compost metagenome]